MMRSFTAYVAAVALTVASLVLADARGASHDIGAEAVICTGAGMITITLGPDGQPIETAEACPDGTSIFAAGFALPDLPRPEARVIARLSAPVGTALTSVETLSPSARGPPSLA
ncbi:hypothetical protein [Maritimibacter sp. HL-12]|jgi:hypothetical protein|uniref:hypothetical protein n=1 Tax=Maritimibacter sp. HL-12 TaxID=1162418 RepID=UPI000A0EF1FD|nr:hypothetical protein [Maritimibacter sp. HL-12]SMH50059.1 hypothetical protein SAMN05661107_2257 [Maritimibacter sp. HL-12]